MKNIVDNEEFRKTFESFFSFKLNNFEIISLIENYKLLTNGYFQNLAPNLDLKVPKNLLCQIPENDDKVLAAICKYQNHPSIRNILEKCNFSSSLKLCLLLT